MIVECHHCGAPLDITGSERYAKCKYCDHTNLVRRMKTVMTQTPAEWNPPPVWTPPPQYKAVHIQLRYHDVPKVTAAEAARAAATASKIGCIVTTSILLMVAGTIAAAIVLTLPPSIDPDEAPEFGGRTLPATGGTLAYLHQ